MISTIILALPFLIIATAAFYLRRKSYLLSSIVVSLGLSSWVAIFYFIRLQGATFGGADFGFAFILMYSPMAVIPMALFGLYLGSSVSLAKAFEISFIAVFAWILLSLGYNHLIYIQKEEYEEKEEIDCDTMPYHCAISQGRHSDLPQLKKQGADIDSVDKSGRTALQRFIFLPEVADTLLQLEANPNAKDWTGSTPLSTALVQTVAVDLELARKLIEHGADVNQTFGNARGLLLNQVIVKKDILVAEFLLKNGAKIDQKGGNGYTACETAKAYRVSSIQSLNNLCSQLPLPNYSTP